MYFIGIDLGTSAVKLLLMDENGEVIRTVSRTYSLHFPHPGWSEQDPLDWYGQTANGLKELIEGVDPSQIEAVSFAGQMHGLVALDENDDLIRPAILWNDGRTEQETEYLNEVIGKAALTEYTGNIAFAGFTAPKLLWMREHEPEHFARIRRIMLPKDYLVYRFSGAHATDVSDASGTLLLDVPRKSWSEPMLEICGVKKSWLPRIHESFDPVGELSETAARDTGLLSGTRIVAGAADNAAAAIGTGTIGHGSCNISLGTSGTVVVCGDSFRPDPEVPLHYFAHADGSFHLLGCMLSAASCYQWWCEDILNSDSFRRENEPIRVLGENSVFFLPYLTGERCPHNDPNVRGVFFGLSRDTSRAAMTQAVMEGVAFGLKESVDAARKLGARIDGATICGGGAKSDHWKSIAANILDLPLTSVGSEEGPGYGAAILAAVGSGAFDSVHEAVSRLIRYRDTVTPEPVTAAKYQKQYEYYKKLYPAVRGLF